MWEAKILDTRWGELAPLMDGFIHIIPETTLTVHCLSTQCWCDPRVLWCEEQGTCIVSHRHLKPEFVHG